MNRAALSAFLVSLYLPLCDVPRAYALNAATFIGLGDLAGGAFNSEAHGISADGSTVVGFATNASGRQAFRWTAGTGMVGLGDFAGGTFDSIANAVSADGSVVVGRGRSATGDTAFRWTAESGHVALGNLSGGGATNLATDVSADGSVVVGTSESPIGNEAFRWTSGAGMVGLGVDMISGGFEGPSVSSDGSTVVGASFDDEGRMTPYRWTAGGGASPVATLPTGGLQTATPRDVSADGQVLVGWGFGGLGQQAFRWSAATGVVPLDYLPGSFGFSQANAMSSDGAVIVGDDSVNGDATAMIWDPVHGTRVLKDVLIAAGANLTGWDLYSALDISPDGRVFVGYGRGPSGGQEAWMATLPVPEPTTLLAYCAPLVTLLAQRRRVRRRLACFLHPPSNLPSQNGRALT